jgi:hypothetical protein
MLKFKYYYSKFKTLTCSFFSLFFLLISCFCLFVCVICMDNFHRGYDLAVRAIHCDHRHQYREASILYLRAIQHLELAYEGLLGLGFVG